MTTDTTLQASGFARIERLRMRLSLSQKQMAALFGTSRITYAKWVANGLPPRSGFTALVRSRLKQLVDLVDKGEWDPEEIAKVAPKFRLELLLSKLDNPTKT